MSKTNGNDSMHPRISTNLDQSSEQLVPVVSSYGGLTKREYFAALALSGLIHDYNAIVDGNNTLAVVAVNLADRLIEELNR